MQTIQINGTARKDFGKKFAKAARREGQVPCIVYGGGEEVAFTIDAKAEIFAKKLYFHYFTGVFCNLSGKKTLLNDF